LVNLWFSGQTWARCEIYTELDNGSLGQVESMVQLVKTWNTDIFLVTGETNQGGLLGCIGI
jgi:hypothetical protein